MKLRRLRSKGIKRRMELKPPGTAPGTLVADPEAPKPLLSVIAYADGGVAAEKIDATIEDVRLLRADTSKNRVLWVNVDGLGDTGIVQGLGEIFGLHKLALEDVLSVHQRAKVDQYENNLFIVLREPQMTRNGGQRPVGANGLRVPEHFDSDQVSMFLGKDFVVTFQEKRGDCFDPVRARIRANRGRMCQLGPDYLVYSIIDAVVDAYFPVLEGFGERLEELEDRAVERPRRETVHEIHQVKRELLIMRRSIWPAREALGSLVRDHSVLVSDETRVYLRDAYDHLVQLIEILENYRELGSDLMDIYLSAMSHKLNEVMKVLAVVSTVFMPLSFIAGVYGMNFDRSASGLNMPELGWKYGYVFALGLMGVTAGVLLWLFWKRGWVGRGRE